ncbi:Lanosterol synthase (Oxidosqualene--lanosterol cyclase) [Gaertneriomyces sp. JEL0708]|nr:Lanosterol synthase (Oxidosqualene--lanosterol cyclase) [Gaertneriomyces sp. JEL0708]
MPAKSQPLPTSTDLNRWRLETVDGRQIWKYLSPKEAAANPQPIVDKYWLGLDLDVPTLPRPRTVKAVARNGFEFLKRLQCTDGHFAGAYDGPQFMTPGYVITMYICKQEIPEPSRIEMIRYLLNTANKEDGGWGIHVEGHSTVFGTALNYVTLRLLGVPADHPAAVKARQTLHGLGGAAASPAWAKFWLSVLGVYEYEGMNPVPPELWLLPYSAPIHPGRWWIHTRMVYLPMGFIYGQRLKGEETELTRALRQELYPQPYETIKWSKQCNNVAKSDVFYPHTMLLDGLNTVCWMYEKVGSTRLRKWAIEESWKQLQMEDENTKFGNLACVNKPLNMLCTYFRLGADSVEFKKHKEHCLDYIWIGEKGMHFNGTDGSQLWDATFIAQAVCEAGLAEEPQFRQTVLKTLDFIDTQQIRTDPENREKCYRDATKGAWPFSRRDQGYTVSDCTAEAIKGIYTLQELSYTEEKVSESRLRDSVDLLLRMQNSDGGFATYEKTRSFKFLEWINPAEVFGDIMVEYSYPECTTAVLLGLKAYHERNPEYRAADIAKATDLGIKYIKKVQKADGSWFGSWAICFTYATWFGLEALASVGEYYDNSDPARRGCEFLISIQREDGGWGESYKSCETNTYHPHAQTQVVQTAWAVMALMAAKYPHKEAIRRGIDLIASRQKPDGRWEQEGIEGVFNRNAMIVYPNYKFCFTIWALGRYARIYGDERL